MSQFQAGRGHGVHDGLFQVLAPQGGGQGMRHDLREGGGDLHVRRVKEVGRVDAIASSSMMISVLAA